MYHASGVTGLRPVTVAIKRVPIAPHKGRGRSSRQRRDHHDKQTILLNLDQKELSNFIQKLIIKSLLITQ